MIVVLAAHHMASLRRTGRFAKQSDTAWASLFVFISIKDFNKAMHNQFVDAMEGHAAGSGQSKGGRTVRSPVGILLPFGSLNGGLNGSASFRDFAQIAFGELLPAGNSYSESICTHYKTQKCSTAILLRSWNPYLIPER